jgi:MFS-type transporter involved in bile tolerance (Atg22 family)
MSDMKPDRWMSWVALATAAMAVFAAVTTLYVGKYSSRAILNQGKETSQRAYYQA